MSWCDLVCFCLLCAVLCVSFLYHEEFRVVVLCTVSWFFVAIHQDLSIFLSNFEWYSAILCDLFYDLISCDLLWYCEVYVFCSVISCILADILSDLSIFQVIPCDLVWFSFVRYYFAWLVLGIRRISCSSSVVSFMFRFIDILVLVLPLLCKGSLWK